MGSVSAFNIATMLANRGLVNLIVRLRKKEITGAIVLAFDESGIVDVHHIGETPNMPLLDLAARTLNKR